MSAPETEAGQSLLEWGREGGLNLDAWRHRITAIEAEAIATERARAVAELNKIASLTSDGITRIRLDAAIRAVSRDEP